MVLLYIYIFFINTHRCKTHTRGRISTHVPVSCFFFFLCISLSRCGVATCYSFFGFVTGKNLPLEKSLRTNVFAVLSRTIFLCATFQRSVRPINSTANSLIRGNCAADTRAVWRKTKGRPLATAAKRQENRPKRKSGSPLAIEGEVERGGGEREWEWNGWKMPDTLIAVIIAGLRRGRRGVVKILIPGTMARLRGVEVR